MRVLHSASKGDGARASKEERLLIALAEHIKLPLMQIARRSELARNTEDYRSHLEAIELTADTTITLLDSYLLSLHLHQRRFVELEPISIGSTLENVAQLLGNVAKDNHTVLEVRLSGRFEPVLAHRQALEAALISLGQVLIEAQHMAAENQAESRVMLAAHRSRSGIVTGLYAGLENLSQDMLRRGHSLYGRARLAIPNVASGSGAGVFVADSLLETMSARLKVSHYHSLSGLAATLPQAKQLELLTT